MEHSRRAGWKLRLKKRLGARPRGAWGPRRCDLRTSGLKGGPETAANAVSSTSQMTSSYRRVLALSLFAVSLPSPACPFFRR